MTRTLSSWCKRRNRNTLALLFYLLAKLNPRPAIVILYINDLVNPPSLADVIMFADDTNLFSSDTNLDNLVKQSNW